MFGGVFMRNKKLVSISLVVFLGISILFSSTPFNKVFAETWYPFEIPENDAKSNIIDAGKIVLDAPAGKHGFLTVKDGHFYFEDGTRMKFWGANLTFKACFPDHDSADNMAAHLAKYGFNIVRIHHIDSLGAPSGIFDTAKGDTQTLSEEQLERLDYLIFKLKEKGIYVDLNLHVGREFTENDDVIDASNIPYNSKIVTLYDDRLIELQKDYARKLLSHYNPYTQKKYYEEPAIALIEITNENSLFPAWMDGALFGNAGEKEYKKPIPSYYIEELNNKWNEWLKKKYGNTEALKNAWNLKESNISNFVKNADFETDWQTDWNAELHVTGTSFQLDNTNKKSGQNSICANIAEVGEFEYGVQLKQLGISLEKGKNYRLSFYAKADRERDISVVYMQNVTPWNSYGLFKEFAINANWCEYSTEFTVDQAETSDAKLSFNLGSIAGKVWLDSVKLEEIEISNLDAEETIEKSTVRRTDWKDRFMVSDQRMADNTEFYYWLEKSFFDEMISYIKDDLGLKVPISTSNFYYGQPDLMAQESGDFMNTHAYWDHPVFSGGQDVIENYVQQNSSLIKDVGNTKGKIEFSSFLERIALSTAEGKPLVVSEWNAPFPNDYEYEIAPLITAYALLQGWDGLFIYSYANTYEGSSGTSGIDCMFNIKNNPVKMSQMPLCSLMFLRNDIKEAEKTIKLRYNKDESIMEYKYNCGSRKLPITQGYIPASALLNHKILHGNFTYPEKASIDHFFTDDQMKKLLDETVHVSDTNEITLKSDVKNKEYLKINTPRLQGVDGFVSGQVVSTQDVKFSLSTNSSAILVTIDYLPISSSAKMVLFLTARQKNTGQKKSADLSRVTSLGAGSVLLEPVFGKVEISVDSDAFLYEAYSLNGEGERINKKKVDVISSDLIQITLDGGSPWIEIVRKSNVNVTAPRSSSPLPTAVSTVKHTLPQVTAKPSVTPKPTTTFTLTPKATKMLTPTPKPTTMHTQTPKSTTMFTLTPKPTAMLTPTLKPTTMFTPTPKPTMFTQALKPSTMLTPTPKSTTMFTPTPELTTMLTPTPEQAVFTFMSDSTIVEISSDTESSEKLNDSEIKGVSLYKVKAYSGNRDELKVIENPIEVEVPYNIKTEEDSRKICAFGIAEDGGIQNLWGDYNTNTSTFRFQLSKSQPFFIKENIVQYGDLKSVEWARDFVETLASKGILQGMGKNEFQPNGHLTRAQFITMIVKALKFNTSSSSIMFNDVKESDWFYNYVNIAVNSNLIAGRSDGTFAPNSPITRQDMAVILSNVFTQIYGEQNVIDLSCIGSFKDKHEINNYAYNSFAKVIEKGLISGFGDNRLAPKSYSTRAQASAVIYKLYYFQKGVRFN